MCQVSKIQKQIQFTPQRQLALKKFQGLKSLKKYNFGAEK